jgi:hypothetical protein
MDSPKLAMLQSFTCFPNLPIELRLKIWRHCLPGPRLVICRRFITYSKHDGEECARQVPTTLFVNRESRGETLKAYCLIRPKYQSVVAFNPDRDTLLLWHDIWPKVEYEFSNLKPYAGPDTGIRSLALTFGSVIERNFDELLEGILEYPVLEELVLWQERSWEDSVALTVIDLSTRFDGWFRLRTESHRLRDVIQFLSQNVSRFASGRLPVLKFTRVKHILSRWEDDPIHMAGSAA